jgi:hypothetical protein
MAGPTIPHYPLWTFHLLSPCPFSTDFDGQQPTRPRQDHRPRGTMHLMGAVISPSDEDSQTFTVNAANGEVYKLRALDAKERQYWVRFMKHSAVTQNWLIKGLTQIDKTQLGVIERPAGGTGMATCKA